MDIGEIKFQHSRKGVLSGWTRVDSPVNLFESAALFRKDQVKICKAGSKITAAVAGGVFIKCYFYHTFISRLRHKFLISRARNATTAALAIRQAAVSTPAPWGFFREYGIVLPVRDYLFTDVLPQETVFMHKFLQEFPEKAAEKISRTVVKLHENGIEHGDLSLRNLYLDDAEETGVIDLDSSRVFEAPLNRPNRIRELARVISSAAKLCKSISLAEFQTMFLDLYKKDCGIDLACSELDSRALYLYNRRRT